MQVKLIHDKRSGGVVVADFHAADEAILHEIDVLHHLVGEEVASEIVNDLMDVNCGAAVGFGREICGFDMRVEDGPLTSPVIADLCVTMCPTVFHQVGPVYVVVHEVEYAFDVASIEVFVGGGEEFAISLHGLLLLDRLMYG